MTAKASGSPLLAEHLFVFVGRVGGAADVQVAQVAERGSVLVIHAAGEVRVVEALIAREFRHVLQHAQALLNSLPAVLRKLLPLGHHVIADVLALLGSHALPDLIAFTKILALLRGHAVPVLKTLANLGLLLRRQVVETLVVLEEALAVLRGHLAEAIHHGMQVVRWTIAAEAAVRVLGLQVAPVTSAWHRPPVILIWSRSPVARRQGLRRPFVPNGRPTGLRTRVRARWPVGIVAALPFLLALRTLLGALLRALFLLRRAVLPIVSLRQGGIADAQGEQKH